MDVNLIILVIALVVFGCFVIKGTNKKIPNFTGKHNEIGLQSVICHSRDQIADVPEGSWYRLASWERKGFFVMKSSWSEDWKFYGNDIPVKGLNRNDNVSSLRHVLESPDFKIELEREPDNPVDPNAIKVLAIGTTISGSKLRGKIGYLDKDIAAGLKGNFEIDARPQSILLPNLKYNFIILNLTILTKIPAKERLSLKLNDEIRQLIESAKVLEKEHAEKAIEKYKAAIELIRQFDAECGEYPRWSRYPVNRLSLLLEKGKDLRASLESIEEYEKYKDPKGLTKSDEGMVTKRKARLENKR